MGARLSSIALITLAATLLSSIAQASPTGDAIEPKLASTVCFYGHQNADLTFTCDQFIESQQWFGNNLHGILDNDSSRPAAEKTIFLLIKYHAPYQGSSEYLSVSANGRVSHGLIQDDPPTGEACKNCWKGLINTQQLMQFERKINQLPLLPQSERPKEINGKIYTVILIQQYGAIMRRDYVDVLPSDLNRFVAETDSLIKNSEWFYGQPRK